MGGGVVVNGVFVVLSNIEVLNFNRKNTHSIIFYKTFIARISSCSDGINLHFVVWCQDKLKISKRVQAEYGRIVCLFHQKSLNILHPGLLPIPQVKIVLLQSLENDNKY